MISVIIPAHNEERGLSRLLPLLCADNSDTSRYEILVICNGCTDGSATIARRFEPAVAVYDLPEPSKAGALQWGNAKAGSFPRIYLDSDVEIDADSLDSLARTLARPGLLASGPRRVIDRAGVSKLASWYYDVWESLPHCRDGLFGRGVIAVSEAGYERIRHLPPAIADDLAISEAFAPHERAVDESATVIIYPARTLRSLVRRRTRVVVGTRESRQAGLASGSTSASARALASLVLERPVLLPKVAVFAGTTLFVRVLSLKSRRASASQWNRDESSRQDG